MRTGEATRRTLSSRRFRYLVLELILATDLKRHFEIIMEFNAKVKSDALDLDEGTVRQLVERTRGELHAEPISVWLSGGVVQSQRQHRLPWIDLGDLPGRTSVAGLTAFWRIGHAPVTD